MSGVVQSQPETASLAVPRRHDLDAIRAFAMLLGIVLHAALSFIEGVPWVVQDRHPEPVYGLIVSAIHGFRMPLFFMLSGYFTALLWQRYGTGRLIRHRAKRIGLPLLLGTITIVPLMWAAIIWAGSGGTANFGREPLALLTDAGSEDNPDLEESSSASAETPPQPETDRDLWTAAAFGDLNAVQYHISEGAAVDEPDPMFGVTPLGWTALIDQPVIADYLLNEAGADPSARNRDQNTPLHTAAFFGRAEVARLLLEAGADISIRNPQGETALDATRHAKGTTEFIAGLVNIPIDFDRVQEGREVIVGLLAEQQTAAATADEQGTVPSSGAGDALRDIITFLMLFPVFHHLWFLWYLCWYILVFAMLAPVLSSLPRRLIPRVLVVTPMCLFWLIPLMLPTQLMMHMGGNLPGFGPDTSIGLIPMPHVLLHYAIFFAFGSVLYIFAGQEHRIARGWWWQLPLAVLVVLPLGLSMGLNIQTTLTNWLPDDATAQHLFGAVLQVLYAWLMIFGLIGLGELLLHRERTSVRYLADSSYWLYLAHLPVIIAGQHIMRPWDVSPHLKVIGLTVLVTAGLLVVYHLAVRPTWIGQLLNGHRGSRGARTHHDPPPQNTPPAAPPTAPPSALASGR